jgi:hypothetical protein
MAPSALNEMQVLKNNWRKTAIGLAIAISFHMLFEPLSWRWLITSSPIR